jgi:hypothetical protein
MTAQIIRLRVRPCLRLLQRSDESYAPVSLARAPGAAYVCISDYRLCHRFKPRSPAGVSTISERVAGGAGNGCPATRMCSVSTWSSGPLTMGCWTVFFIPVNRAIKLRENGKHDPNR